MADRCAICGQGPAPYGLRVPGVWSRLPAKWRRYLWHCGADACRQAAEARRAKVTGDGE